MNAQVLVTSVNGKVASGMVSVPWNGKTGLNMKESGSWVVHGGKDYFCTLKVKCMMEIGAMIKHKVMESMFTLMVPDMKVSG
jgi:hypothetical protein